MGVAISPEAATPVGFGRLVLGVPLYQWQANVLFDLEEPGQVALRCPNEAGKTSHIAVVAILWHMMVYPGSVTVATSGSFRQVKHQLMPGLSRQRDKACFKGWDFGGDWIKAPNGSLFVAFSTNDPGKFEGFHTLPRIEVDAGVWETPPLFVLVDEAKSVDQAIYEAIDRCRPTRLLLMSSPGGSTGDFYWAFGKNRAQYRTHAVGLVDCPHLDREKIDGLIEKYGETHPFILSSVHGQFAEDPDDGMVIPAGALESALAYPPQWQPGERHAFCDFAAGGDENVLALREGNRVRIVRGWRETNTMAACGEFIRLFRAEGLSPEEISGDNGGLGRTMIDRLHELGWPLNRVDNGARARNPLAYKDRASECWDEARLAVEARSVALPDDDEFIAQATSRPWADRTSDGALQLKSKKRMKADGLPSPDRADAVFGALQRRSNDRVNLGAAAHARQPVTEWVDEQRHEEATAGFDAGF